MAVMNSEMWNEGGSDQGGLSRDDILTVVSCVCVSGCLFVCVCVCFWLSVSVWMMRKERYATIST